MKVDVDENEETAGACGISCMPTFQLFRNTEKVGLGFGLYGLGVECCSDARLRARQGRGSCKAAVLHAGFEALLPVHPCLPVAGRRDGGRHIFCTVNLKPKA